MKLGIVISGTNAETNWNAFRLASFALQEGDKVKIFLVGEGVEYEKTNSEKFDIKEQAQKFLQNGNGVIMACGTCIKARNQESTDTCPISTLKNLYELVGECDRVLSF
jgi:uncharacterized protein involved in oxidation of intracellular sulfur